MLPRVEKYQDNKQQSEHYSKKGEKTIFELGERGRLLKLIDNTLELVNLIKLIKPSDKDEKILEKQKETAKILIEDLLRSAATYTEAVKQLGWETTSKSIEDSTKNYQIRLQRADARRKFAHEALMSNINIALRYINEHFALYSEEKLEDLEEIFDKRNEPFIHVQRVKFPANVFLPDKINLDKRNDLGEWGVLVAEELAKYRASLNK